MHVLLTDRLTCPRCGPEFGLILLAERVEDRRVHEGSLGCPNCRDHFPVTGGFGDLRAPPRDELGSGDAAGTAERGSAIAAGSAVDEPADEAAGEEAGEKARGEETMKLAALLGVAEGPGHLALVGRVARLAEPLSDLLDGVEVVAVSPRLRDRAERDGVSRIAAGPGLPFRSRTLRGVAVSGEEAGRWLDDAARVVAATGRVVVMDAPEPSLDRLESAGLSAVLDEGGVVVAAR